MANTYTLISSVTVGAGGASSIDFTSIPATWTDLLLFASTRNSSTDSDLKVTFNTSGGTYSNKRLLGNGSSASSDTLAQGQLRNVPSTATASTFTNSMLYIPNYAGSNQKSYSGDSVAENNATAAVAMLTANLWDGTAAISSIKLEAYTAGQNLAQYSTAYLYGIKNS